MYVAYIHIYVTNFYFIKILGKRDDSKIVQVNFMT